VNSYLHNPVRCGTLFLLTPNFVIPRTFKSEESAFHSSALASRARSIGANFIGTAEAVPFPFALLQEL